MPKRMELLPGIDCAVNVWSLSLISPRLNVLLYPATTHCVIHGIATLGELLSALDRYVRSAQASQACHGLTHTAPSSIVRVGQFCPKFVRRWCAPSGENS